MFGRVSTKPLKFSKRTLFARTQATPVQAQYNISKLCRQCSFCAVGGE